MGRRRCSSHCAQCDSPVTQKGITGTRALTKGKFFCNPLCEMGYIGALSIPSKNHSPFMIDAAGGVISRDEWERREIRKAAHA